MPVIKNEERFAILIDQTHLPNASLPGCTAERGRATCAPPRPFKANSIIVPGSEQLATPLLS